MAGLGESCLHVASLLWAIKAGCKKRNSLTVADKKAYWVLPSAVKSVPYARVKDIQFGKIPTSTNTVTESSVPAPSETELKDFLNNIKKCNSKPALLSLIPAHSDAYIPKYLNPELPEILLNLFDSSLADANYPTLKYIDFVVWTQNGMFIERIFHDKTFWNQNVPKKKNFLCVEFCLS